MDIKAIKDAKGKLETKLKAFNVKITSMDSKSKDLSRNVEGLLNDYPEGDEAKRAEAEKKIDALLREIVQLQEAVTKLRGNSKKFKDGIAYLTKDFGSFKGAVAAASNALPGILKGLVSSREKLKDAADLLAELL